MCFPVVNCSSLATPTPGPGGLTLDQSSTLLGSVAIYSCATEGYRINGNTARVCQANETYNGTEPTCMCECDMIPRNIRCAE